MLHLSPSEERLGDINKEIISCKKCKAGKVGKPVPGEGSFNASIFFVGQAPGRRESLTGRPFVGNSGKYLRKSISEIGLIEQDFFIASPVKYMPRGKLKKSDVEHGMLHLNKQLATIQPTIIVLMGQVAIEALLKKKARLAEEHGTAILRGERTYFLTFHPASAMRFPDAGKKFKNDFRLLKKLISR